jgi:site-specific DNA-cytosine methylase
MRVLVACEYSGRVRDAFAERGHFAMSCDLCPPKGWDLMVAHPPCTDLAVSGARHFAAKRADGRQQAALEFVRILLEAPIPRIALENPVSIISSAIRPATQYVQPWQFGHPETKKTGLWLTNLPPLEPTRDVSAQMAELSPAQRHRVHHMPPGPDRWKERSRTFAGIAQAMAIQWGGLA